MQGRINNGTSYILIIDSFCNLHGDIVLGEAFGRILPPIILPGEEGVAIAGRSHGFMTGAEVHFRMAVWTAEDLVGKSTFEARQWCKYVSGSLLPIHLDVHSSLSE